MAKAKARNRTTKEQRKLIRSLLARKRKPMSMREIAALAECSHNTVYRIKNNLIYREE